ncbi:hypothetical protein GCM10010112_85930 [Actinoplanes lobatus]|uniref:Mono/diheme cytochrome c family protein n=1 Tax=Actinoplanes lobatus TaxID=113568 RepID=A0A7W7HGN5_9ACTN|nr:hypothetical protein [Actinoplanes lobatus]MBB4750193.1 mono/diheme cytochrome c family protein [Actinoplanes lobatus]GGN95558.1 hypothetical protein GCM10010112_85930 [Actinoplanes lobatus]GIE38920.1 hypothetical protein Alo02nite_18180 [Actinoplanes lobatus]
MADAELIDRLIEEAAHASDWRSGSVRRGHLPLFNYWGPVICLTSAGDVVRNDEEDGPLRPADPAERAFALARAAELYPELVHLRPPRPPVATTCGRCHGQGRLALSQGSVVPWSNRSGPRGFVYCPDCDSLGWTVTGPV